MNQVRTTVSLDANLHKQLLWQAVDAGVSLNTVINRRLLNQNFGQTADRLQADMASDLNFFAALATKMGKTDWAKLVREERNRDAR